jgi:hypothetical protein
VWVLEGKESRTREGIAVNQEKMSEVEVQL